MKRQLTLAAVSYAALMTMLWFGFHRSALATSLDSSFPRAFASFALLFCPLWFFGFGAAEVLGRLPRLSRTAMAGAFAVPYFVFAVGTAAFRLQFATIMIAFPVAIAVCVGVPDGTRRMHWRDAVALALIVVVYFVKVLQPAWGPRSALAFFPKLFLADVVLYGYLVVRKLEGAGYWLIPTRPGLLVGLREWMFYVPLAFVIGELTGFIHFHPRPVNPAQVIFGVLLTFLLIAIPEELFFRAILQNLLETRFGPTRALVIAAFLFGLSHFNHGSRFNWKYVLLASLAGIFYGRAWRVNRHIFASVVTHTAVDVVWSLWFR